MSKKEQIMETAEPAVSEQGIEQLVAATLDELESMDMEDFWASFEDPEAEAAAEEQSRPRWRIADDGCADWALRKIAAERAELQRLKDLADEQIARIEEKVAAAERRCVNGTAFLTSKLQEYFGTVPHKATKTTETYRLLNGSLKLKLGRPTMKQNDEALLAFLKAAGYDDMIKTTEAPRWGEYKKRLEIQGTDVVDKETGEIVEGVAVVTPPDTFTVEV